MERQKKNGWKALLLAEMLVAGIVAGTAFGAIATTVRNVNPTEATVPTELVETTTTVPTEPEPETTATELPVTLYDVPLSEELQLHIIQTSEAHNIDPAVVIAVIWKESNYKTTTKGDSGKSLGLMQIQPKWHKGLMDRLDCPDLLDPFQNVTVGINILAGHLKKYDGNISMALMAYNAGSGGANRYWFSKGVYSNNYSKSVLNKAANLETYQTEI